MATIEGSWLNITFELRGRSEKRVSTKGRSLGFELGPRRTPASATAEIRSVLKPGVQPPFAGRNGSPS